ncbi:MAG TPA: glycosyltransferase family 4 protein, partial [candidate division Zixibacteria bacterium]
FGKGGVTESVKGVYPDQEITADHTGIFFYPQTKEALMDAVRRFESARFDPERIRANAIRFDRKIFKERMKEFIERKLHEHGTNHK